jgi:hypothetical protein
VAFISDIDGEEVIGYDFVEHLFISDKRRVGLLV